MKIVLKIIKYILSILITLVFILVLTNFIQLKILKRDYPDFFGYSFFVVVSNSMAPTIEKGDAIIVSLKSDIKTGDIITYRRDNSFITHRVQKIQDDLYLTRGDANNVGDSPVNKNLVVGKVIKNIKGLGIWKKVLTTPKVLIILIITLFLFNDTLREWTKNEYQRLKDFKITKDSLIEKKEENDEKKINKTK